MCIIRKKQHVLHLSYKPEEWKEWCDKESHQDYFDKVQEGSFKENLRIDVLSFLCIWLLSAWNSVVPVKCLFYFSGKTEYQTTKTNKARRSTSFERRPSKRYSRRTLQVKGEMQPCFQGLFFLTVYLLLCCWLEGKMSQSSYLCYIKSTKVLLSK